MTLHHGVLFTLMTPTPRDPRPGDIVVLGMGKPFTFFMMEIRTLQ